MSKSKIRVTMLDETNSVLEWMRPDGSVEFTFDTSTIAPSLDAAVRAYGAKQILADGGAVGRGIPEEERLAKMTKRANGLTDGTWQFRDGHGTVTSTTSNSAAMYAALVAVGIMPGTPETLAAWRSLKPAERAAVLDHAGADARAEYERRRTEAAPRIDGATILARLAAGATILARLDAGHRD